MGFTQFYGPIVNMTLAISASRKDAVIEKMTVKSLTRFAVPRIRAKAFR